MTQKIQNQNNQKNQSLKMNHTILPTIQNTQNQANLPANLINVRFNWCVKLQIYQVKKNKIVIHLKLIMKYQHFSMINDLPLFNEYSSFFSIFIPEFILFMKLQWEFLMSFIV